MHTDIKTVTDTITSIIIGWVWSQVGVALSVMEL